jgi:carbon monoxide dehydrogenase subunit G
VGIRIENEFAVPASIEDAWQVLIDVPRVVPCMPGTELTEAIDERRFRATARLRVGPIELLFRGEGELHGVDSARHTAKLRAKGSDTKGRGAFQTMMNFTLAAQGEETLVRVDSDLTLSGSVAQHARGAGLIKEMARQLSGQFAKNLAQLITSENPRSAPASGQAAETTPRPHSQPHSQAQGTAAVSGIALLFAGIKAWLRRRFGARS